MMKLFRRYFGTLVLLSGFAMGCNDKQQPAGGGDTRSPVADNAAEPAPLSQGTLTHDAAQERIRIATVPTWEQYEAEAGEPLPEPRTRREIYEEQKKLPALYLTHETGTRVVAAPRLGTHTDANTGETCSPALGCYNPNCPRRGEDGEMFAFVIANSAQSPAGPTCPACLETRDLSTETHADRRRYARWVQKYELPETAALLRELTEERRRRIAWERAHR